MVGLLTGQHFFQLHHQRWLTSGDWFLVDSGPGVTGRQIPGLTWVQVTGPRARLPGKKVACCVSQKRLGAKNCLVRW